MRTAMIGLIVAVMACGSDGEWSGTVSDSAGVRIVQNGDVGAWGPGEHWTVETDLLIGAAEGEPEYQFAQIAGIAVGADGRIFVLDQVGSHIKVFTPDGQHDTTMGSRGAGPGELSAQAVMIMFGGGDTLYVGDQGNQRVNMYDAGGASLGSFPIRIELGLPLRWERTPRGEIVNQLRPFALPGQQVDVPLDTMDAIVVRHTDGMIGDTLLKVLSGQSFSMRGGRPEINLFAAEPIWALGGNRTVFTGVNDEYRIGKYVDRALEMILTMPFEVSSVTAADREMILDALSRLWEDAGLQPQVIQQLRTTVNFADVYPAYAQFYAGPDNTLWVQHIQVPGEMSAEERESYNPLANLGSDDWDVFHADGRFLGTVSMPRRFQPMRFEDDMIYGIQRDELDIQYVVRARIARPALETD